MLSLCLPGVPGSQPLHCSSSHSWSNGGMLSPGPFLGRDDEGLSYIEGLILTRGYYFPLIFRKSGKEAGGGGRGEREKHWCDRDILIDCLPYKPFGAQADTLVIEPHWPELSSLETSINHACFKTLDLRLLWIAVKLSSSSAPVLSQWLSCHSRAGTHSCQSPCLLGIWVLDTNPAPCLDPVPHGTTVLMQVPLFCLDF